MLSQILFSCVVVLAVSTFCTARAYNFSKYAYIQAATLSYERGGRVYKFLTHGEACTYSGQHWVHDDKYDKAKGHCRYSAGLSCIGKKCLCENKQEAWDPKVQYISQSDLGDDEMQPLTGKCASKKGTFCDGETTLPERGKQCMYHLNCVPIPRENEACPPDEPNCPQHFEGTCQ